MCSLSIAGTLEYLTSVDWPGTMQAVGTILAVWVAYKALGTWRRELRTQKRISFLDELTEAVHGFTESMSAPLAMLSTTKIGLDAYTDTPSAEKYREIGNSGVIAYIEKNGTKESGRIWGALASVRPTLNRMKSLVVKGQVFDMNNYAECMSACKMLEWSYNQIDAFCGIISGDSMNWEHPQVQGNLELLKKIDHATIASNINEQNMKLMDFVISAYRESLA